MACHGGHVEGLGVLAVDQVTGPAQVGEPGKILRGHATSVPRHAGLFHGIRRRPAPAARAYGPRYWSALALSASGISARTTSGLSESTTTSTRRLSSISASVESSLTCRAEPNATA